MLNVFGYMGAVNAYRRKAYKKGFITDAGWTIAILLVVVVIIILMLLLFILFSSKGLRPISYSVIFVDISNRPYLLSGPLMYMKIEDRQFMEHAIEASVVGSLVRSGSESVSTALNEFIAKYNLAYYNVEIKDGNTVLGLNNLPPTCGTNGEGVCVNLWHTKYLTDCGVLRKEITVGNNCIRPNNQNVLCCQYVDEDTYGHRSHGLYAFSCGNYGRGVCDIECDTETRIELEEGKEDCKDVNNGFSPYCCAPKNPDMLLQTGLASYAEIPLFYRNNVGYLIVTVGGGA